MKIKAEQGNNTEGLEMRKALKGKKNPSVMYILIGLYFFVCKVLFFKYLIDVQQK